MFLGLYNILELCASSEKYRLEGSGLALVYLQTSLSCVLLSFYFYFYFSLYRDLWFSERMMQSLHVLLCFLQETSLSFF